MRLEEWLAAAPAESGAMLAAWDAVSSRYGDDERAMQRARTTAASLAGHLDAAGDKVVEDVSGQLVLARYEYEVAKAEARAAAAVLMHAGVTEVHAAQVLGVPRMTLRRWFGKGTR